MKRELAGLLVCGAVAALVYDLLPENIDCSAGGRACPQLPESEADFREKMARIDSRANSHRAAPPGAMLAAAQAKAAMQAEGPSIRGAGGTWQEYGRGPGNTNGLAQQLAVAPIPDIYGSKHAGRVDDFAYDATRQRLFAAVGTGGIWMTEAVNGDVSTLGELWIPIGDNLPSLATGGVLYSPMGGGDGTVVAAGGDSVMSTGAYHGIGAFWSNDLGLSWHRSEGFPDDALVFNTASDRANPQILYIASSMGLFRSDDAGRSFVNVALPTTPECAGVEDRASVCNLVNVVSDVIVQAPGGVTDVSCSHNGCPVLAAVGWRAGAQPYNDGEVPQAPANGLYKSATGEAGSFVRLDLPAVDPVTEAGFTPQERIGRIEMGAAWGPEQDHGFVYAMVQDAQVLAGTAAREGRLPLDDLAALTATLIHGMYVSPDFGETWRRMADTVEIGSIPGPFVALIPPGAQGWYNQWIQVDPTRALPGLGTPLRIGFGLEETFQNIDNGVPLDGLGQTGPQDFENIGYYFSVTGADTTTKADQHAGIFIPTALGGVCMFTGGDGGVFRQCIPPGGTFTARGWGDGANGGFYTLLPYGIGVAKDGTVWYGTQDNGAGHIDPDGQSFRDFSGDGFYAEVHPDNSDLAYTESQNGGLKRTTDRGMTATTIAPPYTRVNFANWFQMDPLDPEHMMTCANEVYVTTAASTVTGSTWTEVFRLGVNASNRSIFTGTVADIHGAAIYVGACGDCGVTNNDEVFQNRLATNVGGSQPPRKGGAEGWHIAAAEGLPNRLITAIEIHPENPEIVYVGLGGYSSTLRGPHTFGEDPNNDADIAAGNLFRSLDAGQSFHSIQGDMPQIPVNTILYRDGQLMIGTDLGAFVSTDDAGTGWGALGERLPNVPVVMLKMQPGNPNRMFAATYGRHVWTYDFPADARLAQASAPLARGGALGAGVMLLVLLVGLRARRGGRLHP